MTDQIRCDPFWAMFRGLVLYFRDDPREIAPRLETAAEILCRMMMPPEDSGRPGLDEGVNSPLQAATRLATKLRESDFRQTRKYFYSDSSQEVVQNWAVLFVASAPSPHKVVNLPNYLYFEVPREIPEEDVYGAFRKAFESGPFFLGLGGKVLATNEARFPRSGAEAVKAFDGIPSFCKRADDTWLNPEFRRVLAKPTDQILDGANEYIAIDRELVRGIFPDGHPKGAPNILEISERGDLFSHARTDEELRCLAKFMQPLFFPLTMPRMFWKEAAWSAWRQRQHTA